MKRNVRRAEKSDYIQGETLISTNVRNMSIFILQQTSVQLVFMSCLECASSDKCVHTVRVCAVCSPSG